MGNLAKWQIEKIRAVLNVFEGSKVETEYSKTYIFEDGKDKRRQVTLGRGFTEDSGSLRKVLEAYLSFTEGDDRGRVRFYIDKVGRGVLWKDDDFRGLLEKLGEKDEVFRICQDFIYDVQYWGKGINYNKKELGLKTALGMLVVQDSILHGSIGEIRKRKTFPELPPLRGGDEKVYIKRYCEERRDWLISRGGLLAKTVYRMDCMLDCIKRGNWDLNLGIDANDTKI